MELNEIYSLFICVFAFQESNVIIMGNFACINVNLFLGFVIDKFENYATFCKREAVKDTKFNFLSF